MIGSCIQKKKEDGPFRDWHPDSYHQGPWKREGLCSQSLTCLVLLPWTRFRQRLYALSRFIIYDTQRGFIVIWDGISLKIQPVLNANEPKLHEDEKHYQRLWKTFFNSVAIESRKNPKQQRNYVPLLYRELMTEFQ